MGSPIRIGTRAVSAHERGELRSLSCTTCRKPMAFDGAPDPQFAHKRNKARVCSWCSVWVGGRDKAVSRG